MEPSRELRYWQLFKCTQLIFASELPWEVEYESYDQDEERKWAQHSFEDSRDLIRGFMGESKLYTVNCDESSLTIGGIASFINGDLRHLLLMFEDLILGDITNIENATLDLIDKRLPKLNALEQYTQSQPDNDPVAQICQSYLRLKQNLRSFLSIRFHVEIFTQKLSDTMNKYAPHESGVRESKTITTSTISSLVPWLQTVPYNSFWESSRRLFRGLQRTLDQCKQCEHSAMLSLNGLSLPSSDDQQVEFDILLGLCQKEGDFWQETLFCVHSLSQSTNADRSPLEDVCTAVLTAEDEGFILKIRVNEDKLQWDDDDCPGLRYPTALPSMRLSELIECGFLKDLSNFGHVNRWKLALNLAQNLLRLYDSPWLQTLWTSDNLFLLYDGKGPTESRKLCNIHSPFIRCQFSDSPPSIPEFGHRDKHPLILTFGLFLLELAIGVKFSMKTTKSGVPAPYATLKEALELKVVGENISKFYRKAIEGCLNFDKSLKSNMNSDIKTYVRMVIIQKIIQPLEEHLSEFGGSSVVPYASIAYTGGIKSEPLADLAFNPQKRLFSSNSRNSSTSPELLPIHSSESQDSEKRISPKPPSLPLRENCVPQQDTDLCYRPGSSKMGTLSSHSQTTEQNQTAHNPIARQSFPSLMRRDSENTSLKSDIGSESDGHGTLFGTFHTELIEESTTMEGGKTFQTLSETYQRHFQYVDGDKPVKIAIFDTGIDLSHPDFQNPRSRYRKTAWIPAAGEDKQITRIKAYRNFCDDVPNEGIMDADGHGTHVAGIILRLAPRAELYIAKVCIGNEDYGRSHLAPKREGLGEQPGKRRLIKGVCPERVEKAIEWAIEQGVHIINMSFGFDTVDPKLDSALEKALAQSIVIFAAASNSGNHKGIAWPAKDPYRAICVHASNDPGTEQLYFCPDKQDDSAIFMAVGENVSSHWPVIKGGGFRRLSGTSTATPVAAAIGALLMEFTRQSASVPKKRYVEEYRGPLLLQKLAKMRVLLKIISNRNCWLYPQLLWRDYKPTSEAKADPTAPGTHAWTEINLALD